LFSNNSFTIGNDDINVSGSGMIVDGFVVISENVDLIMPESELEEMGNIVTLETKFKANIKAVCK
jgi:hypothetical protein